jgi:hypothetical protein
MQQPDGEDDADSLSELVDEIIREDEERPKLSDITSYTQFLSIVRTGTEAVLLETDFIWHRHSAQEQVSSLLPQATLEWGGSSPRAPGRCKICHIPIWETREKKRNGKAKFSHRCAFQPCDNFRFCLGAYRTGACLLEFLVMPLT